MNAKKKLNFTDCEIAIIERIPREIENFTSVEKGRIRSIRKTTALLQLQDGDATTGPIQRYSNSFRIG